jgi:hypothetical protein
MITSTGRPGPADATRAGGAEAPLEAAEASGRALGLGPVGHANAADSSAIAAIVAAVSASRRVRRRDETQGTAAPGIAATHTKR